MSKVRLSDIRQPEATDLSKLQYMKQYLEKQFHDHRPHDDYEDINVAISAAKAFAQVVTAIDQLEERQARSIKGGRPAF